MRSSVSKCCVSDDDDGSGGEERRMYMRRKEMERGTFRYGVIVKI